MAIRAVDLEGVAENQAKAIEEQVRFWKRRPKKEPRSHPSELPVWQGEVIGRLTREELYGDEE